MSPSSTPVQPFVNFLASWKLWVASAALFVPFAWLFFSSNAPFAIATVDAACGQAPPDMRVFTSADGVASFLADCGPDGRASYRRMQVADLFYPAVVGVFLASSLSLVIRRRWSPPGRLMWLSALPLLAGAFDYLENAFAWLALTSYPDPIATSHLLGVASAAKTTTSWASGLLLFAVLASVAVRAATMRRSRAGAGTPVADAGVDDRDVVGSAT